MSLEDLSHHVEQTTTAAKWAGAAARPEQAAWLGWGGSIVLHCAVIWGVGGLYLADRYAGARAQYTRGNQSVVTVRLLGEGETLEQGKAGQPEPQPVPVKEEKVQPGKFAPAPVSATDFSSPVVVVEVTATPNEEVKPLDAQLAANSSLDASQLSQPQTVEQQAAPLSLATATTVAATPTGAIQPDTASLTSALAATAGQGGTAEVAAENPGGFRDGAEAGTSTFNAAGAAGVPTGIAAIKQVYPQYPSRSRELGEQGVVLLRVEVKADGSVGEIQVLENPGHERLVKAAVHAAKKSRFSPATREGKPVDSTVNVPYRFVLENAG